MSTLHEALTTVALILPVSLDSVSTHTESGCGLLLLRPNVCKGRTQVSEHYLFFRLLGHFAFSRKKGQRFAHFVIFSRLPRADIRHLLRGQSPLPQSMATTLQQILSPAHLRPLRRGVRARLAFFVHVFRHLRSASGSLSWSRQVSAPIMMLNLQLNVPSTRVP